MQKIQRRLALLLLALPLVCTGCIGGDVRDFFRYDPKEDTFWFLELYTNLIATDKADQDHLASLWKRRDSILIKPFHFTRVSPQGTLELNLNFDLSAPSEAIERTGKNQYRTIDLSKHSDKAPETEVSGLDLDAIRVVPGQFYINEFGTLSCYQQMAVSGATMDAALQQITPVVARTVAMAADGEIQRAKKGAKHITWEEVRKEFLEKVNEDDNPTAAPKAAPSAEPKPAAKVEPKKKDDPGILLPLEDESIRLLQNAVADKSVKLRRSGSVITVVVPVSKKDGAEAVATFDLINRTIAERIKAGKKIEEGADKFLNAVQVRYAEGAGLEFSADLAKLVKCLNNTDNPKPGEKMKAGYKTTIAAVRTRGIDIQENFSIKSLLDEYTK